MVVFTHMDLLETRWRPLPKTCYINKMADLVFTCVHVTVAADERVGHPHPDWDPAGRGAQGSGQKCQEGALHAGQHSAVQTTFEKKVFVMLWCQQRIWIQKTDERSEWRLHCMLKFFYRCRHRDYVFKKFLANLGLFCRFSLDLVRFST